MPEPEDDVERVIEAAIWRRARGDPGALSAPFLKSYRRPVTM